MMAAKESSTNKKEILEKEIDLLQRLLSCNEEACKLQREREQLHFAQRESGILPPWGMKICGPARPLGVDASAYLKKVQDLLAEEEAKENAETND